MKQLFISGILVIIFSVGGIVMLLNTTQESDNTEKDSNVTMIDGKQVINMTASGGYSPKVTQARADTPTVIAMTTNDTYDCSIALSIPAIGYRENLPPTGETRIEVPAQKVGTKLEGVCTMGMYSFSVAFN